MKKVSIWRRSMAARLAISQLLVVAVPLVLFLSIFFVWGVGEGITSSTERLQGYVQSRAQYLERSDHWFNKNAVFLINAAKVGDLKTAAEKQKLTPYLTKLATTYGLSAATIYWLEADRWLAGAATDAALLNQTPPSWLHPWIARLWATEARGPLIFYENNQIVHLFPVFGRDSVLHAIMATQGPVSSFAGRSLAPGYAGAPYSVALLNPNGVAIQAAKSTLVGQSMGRIGVHRMVVLDEQSLVFVTPVERLPFLMAGVAPMRAIVGLYQQEIAGMAILFVVLVVLALGVFIYAARQFARPLERLEQTVQRVEQGDWTARYTPSRWGFEINVLGESFNQMVAAVIQQRDRQASESRRAEQLTTELRIGQTVQQLMIPQVPTELPGVQVALRSIPAQTVSGDLVELEATDERLLMAVADVEGTGVAASLHAMTLRSFIRAAFDQYQDLSQAVDWVSRIWLGESRTTPCRVTAIFASVDLRTRAFEWICCGGVSGLLLRREGQVEALAPTRPALGEPADQTRSRTVQLSSGDLLALFTAGLSYARNKEGQSFEESRVLELLRLHQTEPAESIVEHLLDAHRAFTTQTPLADDMTLLALKAL
jgi:serine phosphatase RsbU (regulator of sigma subunit)